MVSLRLRHTGIVVRDMKRALEFYRDALGFKVVRTMEESGEFLDTVLGLSGVAATTVKLDDGHGPTQLELLEFKTQKSATVHVRRISDPGPSHIALTVEDLDELYQRLSSLGICFVSKPQCSPDGSVSVAFCTDPEGNHVELVQVHGGP